MRIIRNRISFESQFVTIPNQWARDARISRRARGLLAEIMSHSEGWQVNLPSLQANGPEGREALQAAIRELKAAGYLTIKSARNVETKRFAGTEYLLSDPFAEGAERAAIRVSRRPGEPSTGEPSTGKLPPKNTKKRRPIEEEKLNADATSAALDSLNRQIRMLCDISIMGLGWMPTQDEIVEWRTRDFESVDAHIQECWRYVASRTADELRDVRAQFSDQLSERAHAYLARRLGEDESVKPAWDNAPVGADEWLNDAGQYGDVWRLRSAKEAAA